MSVQSVHIYIYLKMKNSRLSCIFFHESHKAPWSYIWYSQQEFVPDKMEVSAEAFSDGQAHFFVLLACSHVPFTSNHND